MSGTKKITVPTKSVNLASPKEMIDFATELKKFIVEQKLFTPIQGKNYVNVEGWQFAGAATGILPVIKELYKADPSQALSLEQAVKETSTSNEIRYRAEVELQTLDGKVVGYGIAICSNKEAGRGKQDEYVIASMAQTRAIGKAYRNTLAWLIKMAGYETVPAEEAVGGSGANLEPDTQEKISKASTREELQDILKGLSVAEQKTATPLISKRMEEVDGS